MRGTWTAAALAILLLPGCGDDAADGDLADDAASPEELTAREPTWEVRLDRAEADVGGFQLVEREAGFDLTTGPAGIFYEPTNLFEDGDFTVSATFTDQGAPSEHREAYGLFVGGRNLQGPGVEYTYFLIRSTGEYLIKRREGESTPDLVSWTSHDAVNGADDDGTAGPRVDARRDTSALGDTDPGAGGVGGAGTEAQDGEDRPQGLTNTLAVQVRGDSVRFLVNGTTVETLPTSEVRPRGVAGMRANHRLDLAIRDWSAASAGSQIEPARPGSASDTPAGGAGGG